MYRTSEYVSTGHPDKVADYLSCFILDRFLEKDPMTRYALEVMIKDNHVTLGGEITSTAQYSPEDIAAFVRIAVNQVGYTKAYQRIWGKENTICGDDIEVTQHIGRQSPDIAQGVNGGGHGDQGIFWGMATNTPETDYMPKDWWLARKIGKHLYDTRYAGLDIKTQVTMKDDRIEEIVVAIPMNHRHFDSDIGNAVAFCCDGGREYKLHINGTGKFVNHGPVGDCGITGRKLAVDFYGGNCKIGGGCVDGETEYLSPEGWRKIKDYSGGLVGQVDEQMKLSFVKPERYIQTYSEDVYSILQKHSLSMVLSGNHNVYYRTSKGNYKKKSLAEILEQNALTKQGFHAEIPRFFTFDFAGGTKKYSDPMIRLLVAHCADGTVIEDNPESECRFNCRISVKRSRKIERLRWILNECGIDFKERVNSDGFTRFYYKLDNTSKLLSEHFANPDKETAELLSEEVMLWDGSEKYVEYRTTRKADADFMQFIFSAVTGYPWSLITRDKGEPGRSVCYLVRKIRSKFASPFRTKDPANDNTIQKLPSQAVYCFTVPTGLLLLRRDNKVFVTGNSPWTKDGTKADLSLNLLARARALSYIKEHPECPEVFCAISCRIGSPEILVVFTDRQGNELLAYRESISPDELIKHFRLREPRFAEMCRNGLFT